MWALLALAAAACAASATMIRSNDLWWHLAAGRWILDNGAVPRADPFSFTSGGIPWVDHGWLWQVVAALVERVSGLEGLVLLKVVGPVGFTLAAWVSLMRVGVSPYLASGLITLSLAGARFRFADRPEPAALGLLAVYLCLLVAPGWSRRGRLLGGAAVCLVWANVHASVLVAPLLAAAACAGALLGWRLEAARGGGRATELKRAARDHGLMAAAGSAALLINPWGIGLLGVPFRLREILADPRISNPEWPRPLLSDFPIFYAALAAALLGVLVTVASGRSPLVWRGAFMTGIAALLALDSLRHIGIFFFVLPFAVAASRPSEAIRPRRGRGAGSRWAPAWGVAAAAVFVLQPDASAGPVGLGVVEDRFPVSEADYVERTLDPPRRLYNDVAHGGYLIWRFYPEDRVFVDGRNEIHAALLAETASAISSGQAWQAFLGRWEVEAALVRYRPEHIPVAGPSGGGRRGFAALHFPRSRWALVHWGDAAMVFLRRGGKYQKVIEREEFLHVDPEDSDDQLSRVRGGDAALRAGIIADLNRRLAEKPPPERARRLLRVFSKG